MIGVAEYAELDPSLAENSNGAVKRASYEVDPFDSSDDVERRINELSKSDEPKRLYAMIETGALYNSNVTLAPISRFLTNVNAASAQWFVNPNFELTAIQRTSELEGGFRVGPIFRGFFTLNEGELSDYNLASYQPGAFFERKRSAGGLLRITRVEYSYSLDFFGGSRLGDRHTLMSSLMTIHPGASVDFLYGSIAYSQFRDDGSNPPVTSLDGATYSVGAARFFVTDLCYLPTWTLGADLESAATEGDDFRYRSIRFYGDATIALTENLSLIPSGAIGFRNFPDFTGTVNRDELTGRLGAKLKYEFNAHTAISAVVNYDRFASDNETYDSERFTTGIVATYLY